jgi:hypothetical protein
MNDEIVPEVAVETTAPEQVVTATPEPESTPPEVKTFTQDEVDALIGKRLAREQRKWERQQPQAPKEPVAEAPSLDKFESVEAYAEALAARKADELVYKRDVERQQSEFLAQYYEREEQALDKFADFKEVAYNAQVPITEVMAETIRASEIGPDVAYYLGSNIKEAERISRLTPLLQAKEIGRIEAKIIAAPVPVKKTTNAPAPIAPVVPRGTSPAYDTTDPRSIKTMSTSDWIAAEESRMRKNWEARNR